MLQAELQKIHSQGQLLRISHQPCQTKLVHRQHFIELLEDFKEDFIKDDPGDHWDEMSTEEQAFLSK